MNLHDLLHEWAALEPKRIATAVEDAIKAHYGWGWEATIYPGGFTQATVITPSAKFFATGDTFTEALLTAYLMAMPTQEQHA